MDIIEIKSVTKVYKPLDFWKNDRVVGIDNLSLKIKKGEVFGLLGLNGAGKTTLMKILLGLLKPTSGSVNILGSNIEDEKIRAKIGYLSELPYFPKYLKAKEILAYFAEILGLPENTKKERINSVLKTVRLTEKAETRIKGFSKGMQGRLGLAQAILNDPEILFLDEPMSGLDPLGYKETRDIILDLNRRGRTIFFNSHILSEVEKICNRVGILHKGKLIDVQPAAKVIKKYKNLENYFVRMVAPGGVK
ncbi:MAG: ABC transporter ATP-binding protein [Spirochaetia bacterium]|nr:ABC transporter ATP-binding protein [Spirochaetia bacterium]